jgi:hypothetical protein
LNADATPDIGVKVYVDTTPVADAAVLDNVFEYPVIVPPRTRLPTEAARQKITNDFMVATSLNQMQMIV